MDPLAVVAALAVVVMVSWFLIQPLVGPDRRGSGAPRKIFSLEARADQTDDLLRELDFDHALGKISEQDYLAHRANLLAQGGNLRKELDRQRSQVARLRSQQEESLEREIAARRHPPAAPGMGSDGPAEGGTRRRREPGRGPDERSGFHRAGKCPRCGQAVQVGDRFCPHCGLALNHPV